MQKLPKFSDAKRQRLFLSKKQKNRQIQVHTSRFTIHETRREKKKLKINFWPYSQCHKRPHRKAKIKILLYSSIPSPHFNKISSLSLFLPLLFVCLWKLATVLQLHQMLKAAMLIISIIFITTQFLISHMFIAMPFFLFIPLSLSLSQSSQSSC